MCTRNISPPQNTKISPHKASEKNHHYLGIRLIFGSAMLLSEHLTRLSYRLCTSHAMLYRFRRDVHRFALVLTGDDVEYGRRNISRFFLSSARRDAAFVMFLIIDT